MKQTVSVWVASLTMAMAAALSPLGGAHAFDCTDGKIVIGIAKAQTGGFAFFDNVGAQGLLIAVDQINDEGGIEGCPIEVIRGDMKSDPGLARQVAEELIGEGAEILIAPADFDIGVGASQAAQDAGILSFSPEASSTAWALAIGPHHFTSAITIEDLGKAEAAYANQQGWDGVYIVTNNAFNYFTAQEEVFKQHFKGELVVSDVVANDATDYSATVSKIRNRASEIDFIFLNDYFPHVGTFIKQLRTAGVELPVLGNQTYSSKALPDVVGAEGLENVVYIAQGYYEGDGVSPAVADLVKRYEARFGAFPENANALAGYEGMLLLADALRTADSTDAAALTDALSGQRNFELPGSTIYAWTNRYPVRSATVIGFRNGEFVEIGRVDPR